MAKRTKKSKGIPLSGAAAATKLVGRVNKDDVQAVGYPVEWENQENWNEDKFRKMWYTSKRFFHYHYNAKDFIGCVLDVFEPELDKAQFKKLKRVKEKDMSQSLVCLCCNVWCGAKWLPESKEWAMKKVLELISEEREEKANDEEPAKQDEKPKRNIRDYLRDTQNDIVGELEEFEDEFIRTNKAPKTNILAWLRAKNVPQQIIPAMEELYTVRLKFCQEGREGKDKDIKEGYSDFRKKDWDAWIAWYESIVNDLEAYKRVKVAARKPRVKKPVSPDKLVRKLKYQKSFEELGLTSIKPVDIVHAQQLWIYNTKTRKLGKYVANELDKELTVKGSTILGWDPQQSIAKTLRKPNEQLQDFFDSGKVKLRTFLDDIKAVEVKLNGRINDQTILLKVFK